MSKSTNYAKWIDIEKLTKLQNSFALSTGMSVLAVDIDGNMITEKSGPSAYCDLYVGQCKKACELCNSCRQYGAAETQKVGRGTYYYCHMGLVEFSFPIVVNGITIAYIIGGMVFDKAPSEEKIKRLADKYEIDQNSFYQAALKVPVVDIADIENASNLLFEIAGIISDTVSNEEKAKKAILEMEKTSQLKDDFLANMSHEIRTPMNAVIGLTDIAMQEDLDSHTQDYFRQIQNSGKMLLHIINDILDYSKISSGKMDIIEDDYEPSQLLGDVATIIAGRLKNKEKEVSFIIDVNPKLPKKLLGDCARIQQVLINLANNAVKFTNQGFVKINVDYKPVSSDTILLKFDVIDTGIGIKPEDRDKLFSSFTQVDSKRNRNVEGTGLGLAIVQQLVSLMNGTIKLQSEYEKGSTFSFEIPQKIVDNDPVVDLKNPDRFAISAFIEDKTLREHLQYVYDRIGVSTHLRTLSSVDYSVFLNWEKKNADKERFIFTDEATAEDVISVLRFPHPELPDIKLCVIGEAFSNESTWKDYDFIHFIRKPLYLHNLAMLLDESSVTNNVNTAIISKDIKFTASSARVMIVDDVPMNLKLAKRLLAPYEITVDLAGSGQEALDLIVKNSYDLIFMDHMMPGIDGIDTTRLIRRFHPKYNATPIVALTANVMGEAKKMFLAEGMNDMLAKPIELKALRDMLLKWLPQTKIEYS